MEDVCFFVIPHSNSERCIFFNKRNKDCRIFKKLLMLSRAWYWLDSYCDILQYYNLYYDMYCNIFCVQK